MSRGIIVSSSSLVYLPSFGMYSTRKQAARAYIIFIICTIYISDIFI